MKQSRKGNRKLHFFGIISSFIIVIAAVVCAVLAVVNSNGEKNNNANLSSSYDDNYYSQLLAESKVIEDKYLLYNLDSSSNEYKFEGFNVTELQKLGSEADIAAYFDSRPYLNIHATYSGLPVTQINIDNSKHDIEDGLSTTEIAQSYVKAITIPKSVQYIEPNSFWGFGDLEYFETPFVGNERGSSANYINDDTTVSYPLVKMFSESVYDFDNDGDTDDLGYYAGRVLETGTIDQRRSVITYWYEKQISFDIDKVENATNVNEVKASQFNMPYNLQKIVITDELKFGNHALYNISSARTIEIQEPEDLDSSHITFGYYAMSECLNLTNVILPERNTILSEGLFAKTGLTSIKLPGRITELPRALFSNCNYLESVTIPTSIKDIGNGAFYQCGLLTDIDLFSDTWDTMVYSTYDIALPQGLTTIGTDAFYGCKSVTEFFIPDAVTSIGKQAFAQCTILEKITLPFAGAHNSTHFSDCDSAEKEYNYHNLLGWVFEHNGSAVPGVSYVASQHYDSTDEAIVANFSIPETLKTVVISNAEKITTGALQNFKSVNALTINPECKSIAIGCANGMGGLQNLTIGYLPDHRLGSIFAGNEFSDNNSIDTPDNNYANYRIPMNLYNVSITNQATIGTGAFHGCTPLRMVEIGEATTYIQESIFYQNPHLEQLKLPFVGNQRGEFGEVYDSTGYWWWWRDRAWRNTFQWIFSSTYHADTYANDSLRYFDGYRKFIPNSLKTVEITDEYKYGTYSFRNFRSIETLILDINDEVLAAKSGNIVEDALHGMSNLESLTIPFIGATQNVNGVSGRNYTLGYIFGTSNYSNAYPVSQYSTYYIPKGLTSVTIRDVTNTIGANAFKDCSSITTITSNAKIVQLGASAFANCVNLSTLDLPKAVYTRASNYAFFNCKKLYNIDSYIPSTVKDIGSYAFAGTSIGATIGGKVYGVNLANYNSIGAYAFANCLELESVVIPENGIDGRSLTLGEGVFAGCQYLKTVDLKNKNVTKNMFKDCISLVSMDFDAVGITVIPEGIFNGCKSLLYYDDTTGLGFKQDSATTEIGAYAFKGCESLEKFEVLPSTTTIRKGAFQGCTGLVDMIIPVETTLIESNGWDGCDINFCFWVYEPEEYWSSGWVENWNCDYPVYVIGEVDEDIFTYQYDIDERKYYITGVKEGKKLEGIVTIPSYHNGIKVIGIDSTLQLEDGASRIYAHTEVTKIILPKTITKIIGTLTSNVRIDVYTQLTRAEVDNLLRTSYEANLDKYTVYKEYYNADSSLAFKSYPDYATDNHNSDPVIKGWVRGSKNVNGNLVVSDEVRGWFGGTGFLYYGDDWEFGTGLAKNVPYLKSSAIKFVLEDTGSLVYTSEQIKPIIDHFILPGEVCYVNAPEDDTELTEDAALSYDTQLFNYTYSNNVQVGTASIKAVINRSELAYYNENLEFQLYLVGDGLVKFQIEKCPINLFWNMSNMTEENSGTYLYGATQFSNYIYNGNNWTNSVWGSANVMGLETFNNIKFTGTLGTAGVNAGIYAYSSKVGSGYDYASAIGDNYRGGFKWLTPWAVYRNGIEITKNFYVNITLEVEIQRLDVEIEMVSDSIRETSTSKIFQYRYIGDFIQPTAKAVKHSDGTDLPDCVIKSAYINPDTKAMYPTGTAAAGGDVTHRIYAYVANPMNYRLVDSDGNGNDYLEQYLKNPYQGSPDVNQINPNLSVMVNSQYVVGIEREIEVIKGLITINPQINYTIPVNADRWENTVWNNGTYITGLGPNTVFRGTLVTSGVESLNTTADKNTDYLWHEVSQTGYILTWEDTTISSHEGDPKVYEETGPYHIYNTKYQSDGYYMKELEYYDVHYSSDMYVRILYNDFEIEYYVTDAQTNSKQLVTYTDEIASDNNRHRIGITYAVDGKDYTLDADAIMAQIELLKGYTAPGEAYLKLYYADDGFSTTANPIQFNEPDMQYRIGVMVTGRHFNTYYANVELKTVKSDVVFDTIDETTIKGKEYDREAIDMNDMILKRGLDYSQGQDHPEYVQEFTFIYYKDNVKIDYVPSEAGLYQVRIIANETKYFNACDKTFNFEIAKRKLTFDINITKTYDGSVISYTPSNTVLKTILPGDTLPRLLDDDLYMGTIMTMYTTPNTYSSALGNLKWNPVFRVYYKDGTDVTHNYEVVLDGEMKIEPRIFKYTAPDVTVNYTGNPVTINVDVTYPTTGYTIYYSSHPITSETYLAGLNTFDSANFEPGTYVHYFAIVAEYFTTVYDSATVTIKPLTIEYEDPAKDSVSGDTDGDNVYTVEYTGGSLDYIVNVLSPWNGVVYYSRDGRNWTTSYYSFSEVGQYIVYYKIEAPYHETIEATQVEVRVIIPDDPLPESSYYVQAYAEIYDGYAHSLLADWSSSFDPGWKMIYFSIDGGQTWLDRNPEFTEAGKYDVVVKFVAKGYAPKVINSYVHIMSKTINIEFVDYETTFDGQYHNLQLKLNQAGIDAGDTLVLDPDDNRYYYNGVELNYFYTTEYAVAHADARWTPRITTNAAGETVYNLGFKDYKDGGYYVYLKLTADNHEDLIFRNGAGDPTYGIVKINYLSNPSYDNTYKSYEYCKEPIYPTIDTVHDGKINYYFYPAFEDADGNPYWDSTTAQRISAPQELGPYFVRMQFLPSKNCAGMTAEVYFKIVPKTLTVEWNDTAYYDGTEKNPNPTVDTGTDDELHLIYQVLGTETPIECGTYTFAISIYEVTDNYVLDRYTIDLTIVKREIVVKIEDEMEAMKDTNGNYIPWTHEDYPLYSPNEKNPWGLLGLPLLSNHQFVAEMETDKGIVGKYFYTTLNNDIYINKVNVKSWDIIVVDGNGQPMTDSDGNVISAKDYYDVQFDIRVEIVNPKINLKDCVSDKVVEYDGYEHTIDITNLPAGSTIFYINPSDNKGYVTPIFYSLAGEYTINFFVSCSGYQDTYASAKLIIERAELDIEIQELDPNNEGLDIYNGLDHTNDYIVNKIKDGLVPGVKTFPAASGENGHRKYYSTKDITLEELREFYDDFNEYNKIYTNLAKDTIKDAGDYYCVVYYNETPNRWFASYGIDNVTIKKKDINVTFNVAFDVIRDYNGNKERIPLTTATIDDSGLIQNPKHTMDVSDLSLCYIQTISANAGVYNGKTGFEFGAMKIFDENGMNVAHNYHPVCSDNIKVTINKAPLKDSDFIVTDYLDRIYDGKVASPHIETPSDGQLEFYFMEIDENGNQIPCNPSYYQTDVAQYFVGVKIGEGTNYEAWYGDYKWAYVTVSPKEVEVKWVDQVVTFNGQLQSAKATITDVFDVEIDLLETYFIEDGLVNFVLNAGGYEGYASFNPNMELYESYEKNYKLLNSDIFFVIEKLKLKLQLGDGIINSADTNNLSTPHNNDYWSKRVYSVDTTGYPEVLELPEFVTLKGMYQEYPRIYTSGMQSGIYYGNDDFDTSDILAYVDNVDVTDSIEYDIIGSVTIFANSIIFSTTSKTIEYKENTIYDTLASLDCLSVSNPTSSSDWTTSAYSMEKIIYDVNGDPQVIEYAESIRFPNYVDEITGADYRISDVGTYIIYFTISDARNVSEKYADVRASVTITIEQKEAYLEFNEDLSKVYDGVAVNVNTSNIKSGSGFNGDVNDLQFNFVELVVDSYGNTTEIPLGLDSNGLSEKPVDAGKYKVYITSNKDSAGILNLNYTTLNVCQYFEITPKKLEVTYTKEIEVAKDGQVLGQKWSSGSNVLNAGSNLTGIGSSGLISGDQLTFAVSSLFDMARNKYKYKGTLRYIEPISTGGVLTKQDNQFVALVGTTPYDFNLAWEVYRTTSVNGTPEVIVDQNGNPIDISKNYYIDLTFELYVHYPLINAIITGGDYNYDPATYYHGSCDLSKVDAKLKVNLIQYYAENLDDVLYYPSANAKTNIEDLKYNLPGSYTVYYRLFTDPNASTVDVAEDLIGSFVINISYMERQNYKVDDLDKIYDKTPAGIKNTTNNEYIPNITLNDPDDALDLTKVKVQYQKIGSSKLIEPTQGCIDAGTYQYYLVIPASTYYGETIVQGTFVISQAVIKLASKKQFSATFDNLAKSFTFDSDSTITQEYFYATEILGNGNSTDVFDPTCPLRLTGILVTDNSIVKENGYSGKEGSIYWMYSNYRVYDSIEATDVTINYRVDIDDVVFNIDPQAQTYINQTPAQIAYDGNKHTISIKMINPSDTSKTKILYKNEEGVYTEEVVHHMHVGSYTIDIQIVTPNYETLEASIPLNIIKAEPYANIVEELTQDYNGMEVNLPGHVDTDNTETLFKDYEWQYFKLDETTNKWVAVWDSVTSTGRRPIDAGKYKVTLYIPESANYEGVETSKEFEIRKLATKITWNTTSFTYNGQPQAPVGILQQINSTDKVNVPLKFTIKDINGDVITDSINVGGYIIRAEIDSSQVNNLNYEIVEATQECAYNIMARRIVIKFNGSLDWTGVPFEFYSTTDPDMPVDAYTFEVDNLLPNDYFNSHLVSRVTNKGVYASFDSFEWNTGPNIYTAGNGSPVTDNYSIEYQLYLHITDTLIEYSAPDVERVYDGQPHSGSVSIFTEGDFTVYYSPTGLGDWTTSPLEFVEVGTHVVHYKIIDKAYVDSAGAAGVPPIENVYFVVKILSADPMLDLADQSYRLDKVYDGIEVSDPAVTYLGNTRKVTYTYYQVLESGIIKKLDTTRPIDAGEYKLLIEVEPDESLDEPGAYNYKAGTKTIEFSIYKRDFTLYVPTAYSSKVYDGREWDCTFGDGGNGSVIGLVPAKNGNPAHKFEGTLLTNLIDAGTYQTAEQFKWLNGYVIYDDIPTSSNPYGRNVTHNYEIHYDMKVQIDVAKLDVVISDTIHDYDGNPYTISVEVKGRKVTYVDENGVIQTTTISDGNYNYQELYSPNPETTPYSTNKITRTAVGETVVYVKIVATNFEAVTGSAWIKIKGEGEGEDETDEYGTLSYTKSKEYDGDPISTPIYSTNSLGAQTLFFYEASDTAMANPFTDAPINAGNYFFVLTVEPYADFPQIIKQETFSITPKMVNLEWSGLTVAYDGQPHNPSAKYEKVDGTYQSTDDGTNILQITTIAKVAAGKYTVNAVTTDPNYKLINGQLTDGFVIASNVVDELVLDSSLSFEYLEDIVIKDVDGNSYEMDADGNIIKVTDINGVENTAPNLPYKIVYDTSGTVGTHKIYVVLKDKTNTIWTTNQDSDDLEYQFEITPMEFPNPDYQILISLEKTIWIKTGAAIEPLPIVKLVKNIDNSLVKLLENGTDYDLSYDNNVNETTDESPAVITVTCKGNYIYEDDIEFMIVKEVPKILTLKSDAKIQFITVNYDNVLNSAIFKEDGTVEHTVPMAEEQEQIYLGNLHQDTSIFDVVSQFALDNFDLIEVFDSEGNIIDKTEYDAADDSKLFGNGYTVCLYDSTDTEKRQVTDSITGILFGDMTCDGIINISDYNQMATMLNNNVTGSDYINNNKLFEYLAGMVVRGDDSEIIFNITAYNAMATYLNNLTNDTDFNNFGIYDIETE